MVRVFQSAPPCEGATSRSRRGAPRLRGFNPRPRARGRPRRLGDGVHRATVSIRAPVRGGDGTRPCHATAFCQFQSAPPCEGATPSGAADVAYLNVFQSAPPCEGATPPRSSISLLMSLEPPFPREPYTGRSEAARTAASLRTTHLTSQTDSECANLPVKERSLLVRACSKYHGVVRIIGRLLTHVFDS